MLLNWPNLDLPWMLYSMLGLSQAEHKGSNTRGTKGVKGEPMSFQRRYSNDHIISLAVAVALEIPKVGKLKKSPNEKIFF